MKHYSFDLETLGLKTDSHILSIGMAEFNPETGIVDSGYHYQIDPALPQSGRVIYGDTVKWWMEQSDAAREAAVSGTLSLGKALTFITNQLANDAIIWGNGSIFDIAILEHAYSGFNMHVSWAFYNIRDMRTIVAAAEDIAGFDRHSVVRQGEHHNAADDAVHQAQVICAAYGALREVLT